MSVPITACSNSSCAAPANFETRRSCGGPTSCRRAFTAATCSLRWRRGWPPARAARALRGAGIGRLPDWPDDLPEIVYIDGYGNAHDRVARAQFLSEKTRACRRGRVLTRARNFPAVPPGDGVLVRQFERARRDRGQCRARRPGACLAVGSSGLGDAVIGANAPVTTAGERLNPRRNPELTSSLRAGATSHMPAPIATKTPSIARLNERARSPRTARNAWPRK